MQAGRLETDTKLFPVKEIKYPKTENATMVNSRAGCNGIKRNDIDEKFQPLHGASRVRSKRGTHAWKCQGGLTCALVKNLSDNETKTAGVGHR